MKNLVKSVFLEYEFGNSTVNLIDLPVIAVFACDHQVKKYLYRWNKACSEFSQCCTLTPASISKTAGCLRSGKISHAVACTTNV